MSLQDRVAIVTGALGLLGREHCRALAEAGARVVVADLDGDAAARFAAELPGAVGLALDVTRRASIEALRDELLRRFDRIDVLVNNAAINDKVEGATGDLAEASKFERYPLELWQRDRGLFSSVLHPDDLCGCAASSGRPRSEPSTRPSTG